jgi:type IV pilus assembly protein PilM
LRVPLVYKDKPIFGIDIGYSTVKTVQLAPGKRPKVLGYGYANFTPDTVIEGIIADPEALATQIKPLFSRPSAGHITARRAAVSLPLAKVFIRTLELPSMSQSDLEAAVHFEAEQYVPVPIADLYIDYTIIGTRIVQAASKSATSTAAANAAGEVMHTDVLMVAAPRAIVDSYMRLFDFLDMEIELIESSISSIARAIIQSGQADQTILVMDLNSHSSDLAVVNKNVRLTGSIAVGGEGLTQDLVKNLNITTDQAKEIKYKFGIGPSGLQPKVVAALEPKLITILTEIKKIIKYYQERGEAQNQVQSIILTGGGASLPGIVDYFHKDLNLPITIANPWSNLNLNHCPEPPVLQASMYTTAIGLALAKEVS